MMTMDFMAVLLTVDRRARRGARFDFCKGYANFQGRRCAMRSVRTVPIQAACCAACGLCGKASQREAGKKCCDGPYETHSNGGCATLARSAKIKTARADDVCRFRCEESAKAQLATLSDALQSCYGDLPMRAGKARRIVDDPLRSRYQRRSHARARTDSRAADNRGHRFAIEFDAIREVFNDELGHGGSTKEIERLAGAMGRSPLEAVIRCAVVSSHYQYRKSVSGLWVGNDAAV